MRTFSELLKEYMERTGISDSELARTLGVRRQTIFRWKEGLVARPRAREDVLLVAKRLRLTDEERDDLLLAAGFAPEMPQAVEQARLADDSSSPVGELEPPAILSEAHRVEPESPTPIVAATAQTEESAAIPSPPRARRLPRWVLPLLFIAAAALLILIAIFFQTPSRGIATNLPVAAPGETLIVVGRFAGSGTPVTSPDATERVRVALEREIQAARLEKVRVVVWPEEIGNAAAADTARQRARAGVVLWGTSAGGRIVSRLSVSGRNDKPERVPLDALVAAPAEVRLTLDTARPEEVQALALLTLSQLYLDRGDTGQARALLTQALSRPPAESDAQAALNFYMGYIYQIAEPPEPDQAVVFYSRAIDLAPETAGAYLNRGIIYIQQNKPAQWQQDLARVLTLKPDSVSAQGALCWGYALDKQPDSALPHCNEAVTRDPMPRSRDARGVVYAEMGRLSEAAEDFGTFVSWLGTQPESLRSRYAPTRGEWIDALKAGKNPIDQQTLAKLRMQ